MCTAVGQVGSTGIRNYTGHVRAHDNHATMSFNVHTKTRQVHNYESLGTRLSKWPSHSQSLGPFLVEPESDLSTQKPIRKWPSHSQSSGPFHAEPEPDSLQSSFF